MPGFGIRFRAAFLAAGVVGCGYRLGSPAETEAVAVPIFQNTSDRRELEFELTRRVVSELAARGVRVDPSADRVLEGVIERVTTPVPMRGTVDEPKVESYRLRSRVRLVEAGTGRILREETFETESIWAGARGMTEEAARHEALERQARAIASILDVPW